MRSVRNTLVCLVATMGSSCVGTLDDPAAFESKSYTATSTGDASAVSSLDAGATLEENPSSGDPEPSDTNEANPASADGSASDVVQSSGPEAGADDDAGAAAADAEVDAATSTPAADAGCDFQGLMAARCGNAGCHGALAVSTGLDLVSDGLAARLSGRQGSLSCSSYLLIDTERPEQSALYLKVTANSCGSRMPLGGTLTDGEQACILQWISSLR